MGNSSMTGTYGDWSFVMWMVIFVLAWLAISVVLSAALGKMLGSTRRQHTRPPHIHQESRVIRPARKDSA